MTQHHPALTCHHEVFVPLTDAGCITSMPNLALAGLDVPSWVWAPESNRAWDVASAVAVAWYYGHSVTARVRAWVRALDDDTVDLLFEATLRATFELRHALAFDVAGPPLQFDGDPDAVYRSMDRFNRWLTARGAYEYLRLAIVAVAAVVEHVRPGAMATVCTAIAECEVDVLGALLVDKSTCDEKPWTEAALDADAPDWLLGCLMTAAEHRHLAHTVVANRYEQTGGGPPAEADAEPDATSADATKDGDE